MNSPLSGMTGFARVSGEAEWGAWAWEAKSVNGRGLDVRVSYPQGFEVFDRRVKASASGIFKRGSLQVSLRIETPDAQSNLTVNEAALASLIAAHRQANNGQPPSGEAIAGLMGIKGIVESGALSTRELAEDKDVVSAIEGGMRDVLEALKVSRLNEGQSLTDIMLQLVSEMEVELKNSISFSSEQPALLKAKLEKQIDELGARQTIEAERLAAEIALSAAKADVREELDRLAAHLESARSYLQQGSPIGRKLDFLSQELNREANTLCSKSVSLKLTNTGLALKGLVDQFKEQAANVE